MPDDLRIHLCKSPLLRGLIHLAALLFFLDLIAVLYHMDARLLCSAMGLALLWRRLVQMDPRGVTLACESIRDASAAWRCATPGLAGLVPCELHAYGSFAGALWLHCRFERYPTEAGQARRKPKTSKNLLVFFDAMSDEQWRLLRRQLRLQPARQSHAEDGQA